MFKKLLMLIESVLTLAGELQRNREEIKELRKEHLALSMVVQRLADEITLNSQHQSSEREKLALQLENQLLRFDNKLMHNPSKKTIARSKDKKQIDNDQPINDQPI
jgi:hypothetical protein